MKRKICCLLLIFLTIFAGSYDVCFDNVYAKNEMQVISPNAKSAVLVDADSGVAIFEKNADERLPIASMTKLVSLAVVFDSIDKKIVKLNDNVVVSKTAASVGGSSAFLDAGSTYKLSELLKTIIIASANDSCVAVAEFLCGNELSFVQKMNKFASELKLENTNFANCTGLPAKDHYSSANDMVKIYKRVCDNEVYLSFAKIWMDNLIHPSGRKTELVNTNRLVKTYDGIEGGKTGFTNDAGFCLTVSAKRNDLRLIGVVIGEPDSKTRFADMSKLLDFGFNNFKSELIVDKNIPVTIFKIKNAKEHIEVYPSSDIKKLLNKTDDFKFSTDYQLYDLKAPISAGDKVGKIFVFDENNIVVDEVDLISKNNISEIDFKYNFNKIINLW